MPEQPGIEVTRKDGGPEGELYTLLHALWGAVKRKNAAVESEKAAKEAVAELFDRLGVEKAVSKHGTAFRVYRAPSETLDKTALAVELLKVLKTPDKVEKLLRSVTKIGKPPEPSITFKPVVE